MSKQTKPVTEGEAAIFATPYIVIRVSPATNKVNGVHLSPNFFALVAAAVAADSKLSDIDIQAVCIPDNGRGEAIGCPETHDANSSELIEQEIRYLGQVMGIEGPTTGKVILTRIEELDWRVRDQRISAYKTSVKVAGPLGASATPVAGGPKKSSAILE